MNFEIELKFDCEYEDFYKVAEYIKKKGYSFIEKVDGFDSLYWDFDFNEIKVVLSYNVYEGLSLFSENSEEMTDYQKEEISLLAKELRQILTF